MSNSLIYKQCCYRILFELQLCTLLGNVVDYFFSRIINFPADIQKNTSRSTPIANPFRRLKVDIFCLKIQFFLNTWMFWGGWGFRLLIPHHGPFASAYNNSRGRERFLYVVLARCLLNDNIITSREETRMPNIVGVWEIDFFCTII